MFSSMFAAVTDTINNNTALMNISGLKTHGDGKTIRFSMPTKPAVVEPAKVPPVAEAKAAEAEKEETGSDTFFDILRKRREAADAEKAKAEKLQAEKLAEEEAAEAVRKEALRKNAGIIASKVLGVFTKGATLTEALHKVAESDPDAPVFTATGVGIPKAMLKDMLTIMKNDDFREVVGDAIKNRKEHPTMDDVDTSKVAEKAAYMEMAANAVTEAVNEVILDVVHVDSVTVNLDQTKDQQGPIISPVEFPFGQPSTVTHFEHTDVHASEVTETVTPQKSAMSAAIDAYCNDTSPANFTVGGVPAFPEVKQEPVIEVVKKMVGEVHAVHQNRVTPKKNTPEANGGQQKVSSKKVDELAAKFATNKRNAK